MHRILPAALAAAFTLLLPVAARADEAGAKAAATVAADATPPGSIRFVAQNKVATADGQFRRWKVASAKIDEGHPENSEVEVVVDLASIDTANQKRDDHLRNPDFFDTARFPTATARLRGFRPAGPDRFAVDVELDLHGTKKSFPMEFRVTDRAARRYAAETKIRRTDFGIGAPYSSLNPLSIDEEVVLRVEGTVPATAP
ncbi:YceI family protein [bacterium]|nr:YceI family protein [bacterium]